MKSQTEISEMKILELGHVRWNVSIKRCSLWNVANIFVVNKLCNYY